MDNNQPDNLEAEVEQELIKIKSIMPKEYQSFKELTEYMQKIAEPNTEIILRPAYKTRPNSTRKILGLEVVILHSTSTEEAPKEFVHASYFLGGK